MNSSANASFIASVGRMTKVCCLSLILMLTGYTGFATAWTTVIAGNVNTLSNWSDGSVSPSGFTTPGDTWTINMSMTLPASTIWTLGTTASVPAILVFDPGGILSMSGAGSTFTINVHGDLVMAGGTLSLGGAGTTANVTINGTATVNSGAVNSIASSTALNVTINGPVNMSGGSIATSGASSTINWNSRGAFAMTGGVFTSGGAGSTLTHNIFGNGSYSGTAAMTNVGAGCTSIVHYMLPAVSGTMLVSNTSSGAWSGTNVFIDAGCTAQLAGNFSTTTGTAAFGLTVNGTLICPAAFTVNGTRKFILSSLATLVVAHTTGVNGAIVTTGTATYATDANYTFNGTAAQVTGTLMPATLTSPSVLTINNTTGVTLSQTTTTTGSLSFTNGILHTGAFTITTPGIATAVTGAGATNYVEGRLIKTIASLMSVNYEVGDLNYAPMSLTFDALGTSGALGMKVTNGLHPFAATSGLYLTNMTNHYWNISSYAPAGPATVRPTGTYNAGDIIGGSNVGFLTQVYSGSAWLGAPLPSTNTSTPYTTAPIAPRPLSSINGDYIFGGTCVVLPITGTLAVCAGSTTALADATPGGAWSSSAPSVATVSPAGVVLGVAAGTATIYYTTACVASVVVTVYTMPSAGTITGATSFCAGSGIALTTTGTGGVWSSGAAAVAIVSGTGAVSGIAAGTATISYTVTNVCGSVSATTVVTVDATPLVAPVTGAVPFCPGGTITLADVTPGGVWSSGMPAVAGVSGSGVVTGLSPGTAIIYYTIFSSCGTVGAFAIVTVGSVPVIPAISGSDIACLGLTNVLTDAMPGGTWSSTTPSVATISASGVVTGVSLGTTTISYAVSNVCGTAAATIVVTVSTAPTVAHISGTDSICPGDTALFVNISGGGVWSSTSPGIATISATGTVTGVAPGNSMIIYTVTNPCGVAKDTFRIKIRSLAACPVSVAVAEVTQSELTVFPNPNTGTFTLNLAAAAAGEVITVITDVAGRQVKTFTTTTNQKTEVVLNQPPGIYFVSAKTVFGTYNAKVVVN